MALNDSDLFLVNSGGQSYKVQRQNLSGLSDDNALVLIEDGDVSKQVKKSNWDKIPDDAWLLCNQGGQSYKLSGANFKSALLTSTSAITGISVQDLRQGHSSGNLDYQGTGGELLPYDTREDELIDPPIFSDGGTAPAINASQAEAFFNGMQNSYSPCGNCGPLTLNFNPPLPSDTDLAISLAPGGSGGPCASSYFKINGGDVQGGLCMNGFPNNRRTWLDVKNGAYGVPRRDSISQIEGTAIPVDGGVFVMAGIRINGTVVNGWFFTTFTFQDSSNFSEFPPGTEVYQTNDPTKTGKVIRNFSNTLVICSQQNNWTNGQTITKVK